MEKISAKKTLAVLAAGGVAALAACTTYTYDPNAKAASTHNAVVAGNPVVYTPSGTPSTTVLTPATTQFRAGSGVVESVSLVHIVPAGTLASSASSGASAANGRTAYRVTVRMDDGGFQAVDQDNRNFIVGDRVSFTDNGELMRQ
jgi:hypothetical protein